MKKEFDLTTAFTLKGDWFLPEQPENRLSGEVSFSPETGIHLELIGDFYSDFIALGGKNYETIQGVVEGSRQITLFGCLYVGRGEVSLVRGNELAKPVLTFAINRMLSGWYFDKQEQVIAKTVYFRFAGLEEWLLVTGFGRDHLKIDREKMTLDLHYKLPEPIPFEYPAGCNATFNFSVSNIHEPIIRTSFEMSQIVQLKIERAEGFTLDDLLRISYEFQTFLMLCMYGGTFVKSICFYNPDYSITLNDGRPVNRRIDLYYSQHFAVKEHSRDYRSNLVPYPAIRESYPMLIKKWDAMFDDFLPAISLLMDQLQDKSVFSGNDFLNLAQAAETIHDRMYPGAVKMPKSEYDQLKKNVLGHIPAEKQDFVKGLLQNGNSVSFNTRLCELVACCPAAIKNIFIPDADAFIKEIRDSRNYYTHYTLAGKKHVKHNYELMQLTNRVQFLLVIVLLLHVGVNEELLIRLVENQNYRFGQLAAN